MKTTLPFVVCFLAGVFFALVPFVPVPFFQHLYDSGTTWYQVVFVFVLIFGSFNVLYTHVLKVVNMKPGFGYSIVLVVAAIVTCVSGFVGEFKTGPGTVFGFAYNQVLVPLQGTMFALLGFFVASAAFRAFRARSVAAGLLLGSAIIIMFFNTTLGESIWQGIGLADFESATNVKGWIMNTFNTPMRGAIVIGTGIGTVAAALKIIFGFEKPYVGGKD